MQDEVNAEIALVADSRADLHLLELYCTVLVYITKVVTCDAQAM